MTTTWPLADLVQRARGGDQEAFGALYQRFDAPIRTYLARWVSGPDIEDLAHDVWLKAWQSLPGANEGTERLFQAWLFRIATNKGNDAHRHRTVLRWVPWETYTALPHPTQVAPDNPERDLLQQEAAGTVRAIVQQLPQRYQALLLLDIVWGYSVAQMAPLFGVANSTMKQLRLEARQAYRRAASGTFRPESGHVHYAPFHLHGPVPAVPLGRKALKGMAAHIHAVSDGRPRPFRVVHAGRTVAAFATREEALALRDRLRASDEATP